MRLYHYAVFLRARQGTVRRNVAVSRRDVKLAALTAQRAVERHLKESVRVLDTVPLRERAGRADPVTLKPRSRNPVTVKKVKWVLARRPKARESLILTKRGARPLTSDRPVHEPYESVTDKLRDQGPKRDPSACMNERCIKRGRCSHKRAPGVELILFETRVRVGAEGYVMWVRCFAPDAAHARRVMRKTLSDAGFGHKRLARVSPNPGARPIGLGH